jgi:hypothetical protein
VNGRVTNPPPSPIVTRLISPDSDTETEEVMALVGYVGPGPGSDVTRLYPDLDLQRWMDFPEDDIVDSAPLDGDDVEGGGRTVVWVRQETMFLPVFTQAALRNLEENFAGSEMSVWPFIPATRYVAAQLLDLVAPLSDYEEE